MLRAFRDNLRRYAMPTERACCNTIAKVTKLQKKLNSGNWAVSRMPEPQPIYAGPQPAQAMRVFDANTLTTHFETILRSSGT